MAAAAPVLTTLYFAGITTVFGSMVHYSYNNLKIKDAFTIKYVRNTNALWFLSGITLGTVISGFFMPKK